MSPSPAPSLHTDITDTEDSGYAYSVTSAALASQIDIRSPSPSPSLSPRCCQRSSDMVMPDLSDAPHASAIPGEGRLEEFKSMMCGGICTQDDVVGQYLARRDAQKASMEALQAPIPHYVSEPAGYTMRGHHSEPSYDSYAYTSAQGWYPDPEAIRHLHTLHSLLPHISPERKLNALSGFEIDIIDGNTSQVFCRAVPKKLLVLFLGREVVSKFIRTFARSDSAAWRGPPTEQKLVIPPKVTSAAAIKILVSWVVRACKFATMRSMKPLRIPNNLFVACSLARTLALFRLHRDAYRLDVAITQQFSSRRPIFAVEVETMWICLGENNKYVYACIRALCQRTRDPRVAEDLQGLSERHPELYARLCNPGLNELHRPQFGREWFAKLKDQRSGYLDAERLNSGDGNAAVPPSFPLNNRHGGSETSNRSPQGVRILNPSAPPFRSVG